MRRGALTGDGGGRWGLLVCGGEEGGSPGRGACWSMPVGWREPNGGGGPARHWSWLCLRAVSGQADWLVWAERNSDF
jgi:hypothetical protein